MTFPACLAEGLRRAAIRLLAWLFDVLGWHPTPPDDGGQS